MSLAIRTATRRAGVNMGNLARLQRGLDSLRAQTRGLSDHYADQLARRRDIRAYLAADLNARVALASVATAEDLPPIDWREPEIGLAQVPEDLLRTVGIDVSLIDEALDLNDQIAANARALAAANEELQQRSTLVARLTEWAHHAA